MGVASAYWYTTLSASRIERCVIVPSFDWKRYRFLYEAMRFFWKSLVACFSSRSCSAPIESHVCLTCSQSANFLNLPPLRRVFGSTVQSLAFNNSVIVCEALTESRMVSQSTCTLTQCLCGCGFRVNQAKGLRTPCAVPKQKDLEYHCTRPSRLLVTETVTLRDVAAEGGDAASAARSGAACADTWYRGRGTLRVACASTSLAGCMCISCLSPPVKEIGIYVAIHAGECFNRLVASISARLQPATTGYNRLHSCNHSLSL